MWDGTYNGHDLVRINRILDYRDENDHRRHEAQERMREEAAKKRRR